MKRLHTSIAAFACLALLCTQEQVQAETQPTNHVAVLAPFVNDDSFAVAYIDVSSLNAANMGELFSTLPKFPEAAQAEMLGFMMVSTWAKSFQDAGGQGVYVVAGLSDIYTDGGPLVIATTMPGKRPEDVEQMVRNTIGQIMSDPSPAAARPIVQRKGDAVFIGTKATVAKYARFQPTARNELIAPLTNLTNDGAVAALVFCPGADYRRVSRELWPELPGALAPLRGELADRWLHFEAAVNLPPNPKPRITLQAKDAEAAAIFVKLYRDLPAAIGSIKEVGEPPQEVKQTLQAILEAIPPQQDGARVTLTLSTDKKQLSKLQQLLAGATDKAIDSSRQKQRVNQLKQLALAMLNFESAKKHLPPAAIYDKQGRPLLSWRVAILPYLEEGKLYQQFHLDEPWDSAHNRALIVKMPHVFADPDPKLKQLAREGKTTYQVPVGPDTIFFKKEGTHIREIRDGTSKTIAIVEVEPQSAVTWTKPEDWQVDMSHPRNGVERTDRNYFVAARCDCSVHTVPTNIDEKTLRALLTRGGGEIIDER